MVPGAAFLSHKPRSLDMNVGRECIGSVGDSFSRFCLGESFWTIVKCKLQDKEGTIGCGATGKLRLFPSDCIDDCNHA